MFFFMITAIFSLKLFICIVAAVENNDTELKLVHILFRHGIRTPVYVYPSETRYPLSYWKKYGGLGHLHQEGMKQMYDYGRFIRKKYSNFLTNLYDPQKVYVRSTNYDRTLMSAYTLLTGLYPPSDFQIWNNDILWQPIPVHTNDIKLDPILHANAICPHYDYLLNETLTSKEYFDMQDKEMPFIKMFANYTGIKKLDLFGMWRVADSALVKKALKLENPKWVTDNYDKINELYAKVFDLDYYTEEMAQLGTGGVLNDMVNHIKTKLNNGSNELFLYSAHDTYLAAMTKLLNFNIPVAHSEFGAAITFELVRSISNNTYYMQFFFKNSEHGEPIVETELEMKDCKKPCTLERFMKIISSKIVTDFTVPCQIFRYSGSNWQSRASIFSMLLVLVVLLLNKMI